MTWKDDIKKTAVCVGAPLAVLGGVEVSNHLALGDSKRPWLVTPEIKAAMRIERDENGYAKFGPVRFNLQSGEWYDVRDVLEDTPKKAKK